MKLRLSESNNSGSSSDPRGLTIEDLASVRFGTYLVIIRLLLARADYQIVRSLGRRYLRSNKPNGGADLIAACPSRQGPIKVLIQVKQETRRLQRRYIDELRGKMLRAGISHGLVITLGSASKPALEAATEFPGRPISIIEGAELINFLKDTLGFSKRDVDVLQRVRFASHREASVFRQPAATSSVASDMTSKQEPYDHSVRAQSISQLAVGIAFVIGLIVGALLK